MTARSPQPFGVRCFDLGSRVGRWPGLLAPVPVVVVSLLAACGPAVPDGGTRATTTVSAPGGGTDGDTGGSGGGAVEVAYPGGGPVDRMLPGDEDAYGYLERRECQTLRRRARVWSTDPDIRARQGTSIEIYAGAAAACLMQWDEAQANLALVDPADVTKCVREVALAFLQAMVEAHRRQPGAPIDISTGGQGCPDPTSTSATSSTTTVPATTTTSAPPSTTSSAPGTSSAGSPAVSDPHP